MRRRQLLAAAAAAAAATTGCIHRTSYAPEDVRAGAESRDYETLRSGEANQGDYLHFAEARVQEVFETAERASIYTRYDEEEEDWTDDVWAAWDEPDALSSDDEIEFWAVYEGVYTHDSEQNGRELPDVTMVDFEHRD